MAKVGQKDRVRSRASVLEQQSHTSTFLLMKVLQEKQSIEASADHPPSYKPFNCPNCKQEWKYDPQAKETNIAVGFVTKLVNFMVFPGVANPKNRHPPAVDAECSVCGFRLRPQDVQ